jgi:hypothetical protein
LLPFRLHEQASCSWTWKALLIIDEISTTQYLWRHYLYVLQWMYARLNLALADLCSSGMSRSVDC